MTAQEFIAGAEVTPLGDDWGKPLWRFHNEAAGLSIEVHAADEDAARAAVLDQAELILGSRA